MPLLDVDNLYVGYGKLQIVFGANLELNRGEILVIVGPNGSGKSTLLKGIIGLATVHKGRIFFEGKDITRKPPHEKARMGLAYLPQLENTFERLTVRENLLMAGYTLQPSEYEGRLEEVLDFLPVVREYLDRKVYTLSGGERQMVALAMAIIRSPKAIFLDEPTAALAPKIALQVLEKITALRDEFDLGILLVEQNARKALEIGDRALLLVAGKVAYYGDSGELLKHPELAQLYLGIAG